jgi:hypothetical protein
MLAWPKADIGPFQNAKLSRYDAISNAFFGGDMRRRDFIAAMGAAAACLSAPRAVRAQQTTTRTIGWLSLIPFLHQSELTI